MDAFIVDALRTPRGKGKDTGSLHGLRPLDLVAVVLRALEERNDIDTASVQDLLLGCVTQVGEQGGAQQLVIDAAEHPHRRLLSGKPQGSEDPALPPGDGLDRADARRLPLCRQKEGQGEVAVAEVAPALGAEEDLGDFHHTSGARQLVALRGEFSTGGISKPMAMTLPHGRKASH